MKSKKEQKTKKQSKNGNKAVAAETAKTRKQETGPKRTNKQVVIEAITANNAVTNQEMIAAVKSEFPKSAFKDSHAAWYRSQARKGLLTGAPLAIPLQVRKQSKADN